jgi:hypothetical protein
MLETPKSITTLATLILTRWSLLDEKEKMSEERSASRYSGDASSVIPLSRDLSVVPLFLTLTRRFGTRVMVRWRRRDIVLRSICQLPWP